MMEFKTQQEFFDRVGDHHIHPTSCGEVIYSPTIEELYQHFKERFLHEARAKKSNAWFDSSYRSGA